MIAVRKWILLSALVPVLSCGGAAGARGGAGCVPPGSRLLATDARASVYVEGGRSARFAHSYGCLAGRAGRVPLGTGVNAAALAGTVAAYASTAPAIDTATSTISVVELANGRRAHTLPAASAPIGPESFTTVTAIVVSRRGTPAWIASRRALGGGASLEVHGASTLLDRGTAIASDFLRLRANTLHWRSSGRERSARLR